MTPFWGNWKLGHFCVDGTEIDLLCSERAARNFGEIHICAIEIHIKSLN